jgi:hypothetical protein
VFNVGLRNVFHGSLPERLFGPERRTAFSLSEIAPSLVVDLCGGHLPVAEELLHIDDIHLGIKEERAMTRAHVSREPAGLGA